MTETRSCISMILTKIMSDSYSDIHYAIYSQPLTHVNQINRRLQRIYNRTALAERIREGRDKCYQRRCVAAISLT